MCLALERGYKLLRWIELSRQEIDDELLAARMEVAGLDDDDILADGEWLPTIAEIEAARDQINAGWEDEERERRWRFTKLTRQQEHFKRITADKESSAAYQRLMETSRLWKLRNVERVKAYKRQRRELEREQRRFRESQMTPEQREAQRAARRERKRCRRQMVVAC
jgi:hypothetical protein